MSNYLDEWMQREMYEALYPPKKIKNMREKAAYFLSKTGFPTDYQKILAGDINIDLAEVMAKFAQTIQGGLNWVPTDQEKPKNLDVCLVVTKNRQGRKGITIAQYTDGYGLLATNEDDFGVYHEEDDEYYCPEGFYEFASNNDDVMYHIDPVDKKVTHFIPRDYIPLP